MNNNNKQNMKNTMKIKSLLSFFVPAALMALVVASCSDYDNGFTESAIRFTEEFRKAYGDIDPEQDWNLAERATVTVTTMSESEVKIYALRGDEYVIVGDYEGVKGTRVLGFDMVEGTTNIMVTDGETAEQTVPGGVVTFGGTRTVYGGNGTVTIQKITDPNGLTLVENGVTYPMYKEATEADYDAMKAVIPEIGYRKEYTNLNKVTHDFSYVSNGTFIIYPYYWETSSLNTIGIYYNDANGNRQEVDLYKIKEGDEFQYATSIQTSEKVGDPSSHMTDGKNVSQNGNATLWWNFAGWYKALTWNETWGNVAGGDRSNMFGFSANDIKNATKLVIEGIDFQQNTKAFRIIFWGANDERAAYVVHPSDVTDGKYEFLLSNLSTDIRNNCTICLAGGYGTYQDGGDNPQNKFREYGGLGDNDVYGELRFTSIKLVTETATNSWQNYSQNFCSEIYTNNIGVRVRGQGIKVNLPKGTVFGMYLKKTDSSGSYTFYSQGDLNEPGIVGCGVTDNGAGTVTDVEGMRPCYASTFHVGDQMFLGFEDWPNVAHLSDFDLNDVVFAFDGCKPTIINEDPTPGGTWLLVCEDLGGSFDTDYNDVIFKVEHISGQEFANVTAMAAGGTLASYICFCDPTPGAASHDDIVIGEIHQLFNVAPQKSGAYTPINVISRWDASGRTISIPVDKNWQIAYNVDATNYTVANLNSIGNTKGVNMGGFYIRTLKSGEPAPTGTVTINDFSDDNSKSSVIAAPSKGSAPYILCLPYTYKVDNYPTNGKRSTLVWAWPQELCTICSSTYQNGKYTGTYGGAYYRFGDWVGNYTSNKDWYKIRTNGMTVELWELSSENINQGGNTGEITTPQPNPISNKGPLSIMLGTGVDIRNNLTNVVSSGEITWSITPANTAITNQNYYVPTNAGLYTITATQAAVAYNSNQSWITPYEAGSTSFTLRVYQPEALSCVINGKTYYLAWQEKDNDQVVNKLVLREGIWGSSGKWLLEPSGVGDYYFLKNLGNGKYLSVENGSGYYAKWLDTPDQMSRFMILSDGRIHRYNATNRFLGYYTDDDNALRVDANAGASGGSTAIVFTRVKLSDAY